jgi:hypothetical protein
VALASRQRRGAGTRRLAAPGVAGGIHDHQHLGRVGAVGKHVPQPRQILRSGGEPASGRDESALLVGEADLVSDSTRDIDAQAKRDGELPSDDGIRNYRLPAAA